MKCNQDSSVTQDDDECDDDSTLDDDTDDCSGELVQQVSVPQISPGRLVQPISLPQTSPGQLVQQVSALETSPGQPLALSTSQLSISLSTSANQPHTNLQSNKRRSSEVTGLSTSDINFYSLKLLARFNISFKDAGSVHMKNFVNALNCSYHIPSEEQLNTEVLPLVCSNNFKSRMGNNLSETLIVCTYKIKATNEFEENYLVSVVLDKNGKQNYVRGEKMLILDLKHFEDFCMQSVDLFLEEYRVYITFIVHNTDFDCARIDLTNIKRSIFSLKSFEKLFTKLRSDEVVFVVTGSSFAIPQNFYDSIDNLNDAILAKNNSLSWAVKYVIWEFANSDACNNQSAKHIIRDFLKPIHFVARFFHPSCRDGNIDATTCKQMLKAVECLTSRLGNVDSVSYHMEKIGTFRGLFDPIKNYSVDKFWRLASADHEELSSIAQNILKLPAFAEIVNLSKIVDMLGRSIDQISEMRSLSIAAVLEDNV
ncbi:hypothetical protein QAD02_007514 [Eretmocerus hayati]|uniref:Uncharacterized protein n=1 Tax=Eretmocerus hayati TaxID=131215 RepID=A0ACC2N3V5_9HYME|nr:hypothetical protein QAD02_007514 [Eretmocerus hayati]